MENHIREVKLSKDRKNLRVVFGPHYFMELHESDGKLQFKLGITHHGIKAEASEVGGQLEEIIGEIAHNHPDLDLG